MTEVDQPGSRPWWRDAVIYEIYPRSFSDSDGDGDGDLQGIIARLPYLAELGVDGIWIAPWYPSPMADGGYDVSDYRGIHPMFGTVDDAVQLLDAAHRHGLKVIIDLVPNHCSSAHPWFLEALASPPDGAARDRFFFRDGKGPDGEAPPNNWISCFGGPAWKRVIEADGRPGQWYMHMFDPSQPDLNWRNHEVLDGFDDILRFWLDLGVDGFRVDAAPAMAKDPDLRDADYGEDPQFRTMDWVDNPHWDMDAVHDILRRWRALGDTYPGDRVWVAESVVSSSERLSLYVRRDELHTAFNFHFMKSSWDASALREVIDETLATLAPVGAPATWVLSSHDEPRHVTRYGRANTSSVLLTDGEGSPVDLELGTRRARAALLLMLALPGSVYLYQGEELGLPQVEDLPVEVLQDPIFHRSGGAVRGRDGCRVPMPWSGTEPPFGFSPEGARTWLPQPPRWAAMTTAAQLTEPDSMLSLYRTALRLRREVAGFVSDTFAWNASEDGVLDFARGSGVRCVVNISGAPLPLGDGGEVLLSSVALQAGKLPHDAAVWLRT